MEIKSYETGFYGTNCHIIVSGDSAVMFDPDFTGEIEKEEIYRTFSEKELKAVILTHGHFDHIGSVDDVCSDNNVPVYIHEQDSEMLCSPHKNASYLLPNLSVTCRTKPITFKDKDVLEFGDISLTVMHTPGHSKGSSCFICDDAMIVRDTLFRDGMGRTDLYGGDTYTLFRSIEKIFALEKNYKLYCGHGPNTTILRERR